MLAMPTKGFGRSVNEHNVELDALCDWIEGSVLLGSGRLSQPEVVDVLCENFVYAKQDMASDIVSMAWSELRKRQMILRDATPYQFDSLAIQLRRDPWNEAMAHTFCVVLSLAKWYRDWAAKFSKDYTLQGQLFEELTKESVETIYSGWKVYPTGWSRTHSKKLDAVVKSVAGCLGESVGNLKKWTF